jgi:hypothetical protein
MKNIWFAVFATSLVLTAGAAHAQTDAPPAAEQDVTVYQLVLRDGSRLFGTVESQSDTEVEFRTQSGTLMTTHRSEIASLKQVTGTVMDGEFMPADPNATRLFFGPTGRALRKGQAYLGVYEFFMPFVQVGVTDRFSIGGGTPLLFGIDNGDRPFWITPKLQVLHAGSTDIAVGVMHAFAPGEGGGGIGYVVGTHGSAQGSDTGGLGIGYAVDGGRAGVAMLGAERQVRRNLKVISENYIWKNGNGIASAGVRFFGDRLSADLALAIPLGADELFAFPVVNFVYVF